MTDLVLRPAVDLQLFAQSTRDIFAVAKVLAETPFAPSGMRGDAAAVCAAIMYGAGLNMDPMTSLRNIHVIDNQPTLSALALRGLVLSQGHQIELVDSTDTRVIMRGRRKGSERWQEVTWTIERAKKAGLTTKKNWTNHPQAMLVARASSELCRLIAADVLMGCPYSTEEIGDGVDPNSPEPPTPAAPQSKARPERVVQREPVKATVVKMPEPDFGEPETPPSLDNSPAPAAIEQGPTTTDEPINDTTRRALMATFNEAGIRARDARMARVVEIVGRHVDSVNQLSQDEARAVIDAVKGRPPRTIPTTAAYDWPEMAS